MEFCDQITNVGRDEKIPLLSRFVVGKVLVFGTTIGYGKFLLNICCLEISNSNHQITERLSYGERFWGC